MTFISKIILYAVILFIIEEILEFIFKVEIQGNLVVVLAIVLTLVVEVIQCQLN